MVWPYLTQTFMRGVKPKIRLNSHNWGLLVAFSHRTVEKKMTPKSHRPFQLQHCSSALHRCINVDKHTCTDEITVSSVARVGSVTEKKMRVLDWRFKGNFDSDLGIYNQAWVFSLFACPLQCQAVTDARGRAILLDPCDKRTTTSTTCFLSHAPWSTLQLLPLAGLVFSKR